MTQRRCWHGVRRGRDDASRDVTVTSLPCPEGCSRQHVSSAGANDSGACGSPQTRDAGQHEQHCTSIDVRPRQKYSEVCDRSHRAGIRHVSLFFGTVLYLTYLCHVCSTPSQMRSTVSRRSKRLFRVLNLPLPTCSRCQVPSASQDRLRRASRMRRGSCRGSRCDSRRLQRGSNAIIIAVLTNTHS